MNCPHLDIEGLCKIGLYGGNPYQANCLACISQGNNSKEFADDLFASREKTHPPKVRRVSGCCDSAENPPL